MRKKSKQELGDHERDRRDFLSKAGKVAAVAPAVALLLSAGSKSASAQIIINDLYNSNGGGTDYTQGGGGDR